jgi:drug/metabolite transporter (DMT)-like permease
MVITSLRWAIVSVFLVSVTPRAMVGAWPELRRNGVKIVLIATFGFSAFNTLFYLAAHYTTAVNIAILQGAIPIFVVLGALAFHRTRINSIQSCGIAATLLGVAVVATKGNWRPRRVPLELGDALMLVACVFYSGYTLALRDRPNLPPLVFFSAMAIVAFITSLPLLGYEVATGTALWPTPKGWAILLFVALFPSFLAQLAFMRGVRLIGPGRAGLFANLVPIFGSFFAVLIIGELFGLFHLVALLLVIGGILTAEIGRIRAARVGLGS